MNIVNWNTGFRARACMASILFVLLSGAVLVAQEPVVPVVDGELGQCTADFTITDRDKNPLYNAKIDVSFRHGFFGVRKMSLQVGTNIEGKARVIGLPDKSKKTYEFTISLGELSETVLMRTVDGCQAAFEVVLE